VDLKTSPDNELLMNEVTHCMYAITTHHLFTFLLNINKDLSWKMLIADKAFKGKSTVSMIAAYVLQ